MHDHKARFISPLKEGSFLALKPVNRFPVR